MKTIPPPCPEPDSGPKYWRSLDDLADTPEFRQWVEREFPSGASEFTDPVSRRNFVKLMSASFLLAGFGLTGCRRPMERIVPFSKTPENYIHGVPQYYATSMPVRGSAVPLLVKSHEGRPVKIEGNAEHPINADPAWGEHKHAGTDRFAQASLLSLYDPDRAQRFTFKGVNKTREEALDALSRAAQQFEGTQGEGLCFLMGRSSSPSRARLQRLISQRLPQVRFFVHEPVDLDVQRQGASLAFGKSVTPYYRPENARCVLSLDADFLATEEDSYRLIRGFSKGRKLDAASDEMNRLYVVESLTTITGANADHRMRLPSSAVFPLTCVVFAELIAQANVQAQDSRAGEFRDVLLRLAEGTKFDRKWVSECVKDLLAHRGKMLVIPGHRQPVEVHLLAHAVNVYLGGAGSTVSYLQIPELKTESISELARALQSDQVDTLVITAGNPAYDAPDDLEWSQRQRKAKTVIRLGYYEDETFAGSDWHLPAAHYLETWGDARTGDGTVVPVQPLIQPLFGGLTELEVLARAAGLTPTSPHEIARATFQEFNLDGVFEENWKKFLHDGFLAGSAYKPEDVKMDWDTAAPLIMAGSVVTAPTPQKLEVVFHGDYSVDDGRYINNGWLQELPDPISKISWDNVITISEATAAALNVYVKDEEKNNLTAPLVRLTIGKRSIEGPAWIQPGFADNVVGVCLGYGQKKSGRIGRNSGYNGYPLRTGAALHIAGGAKLESLGAKYPLSCTQNHWSMEGRPIIREANLEEYRKSPGFAQAFNMEEPPDPSPLYRNPLDVPRANGRTPKEEATHWWGMSIDLGACVGCSACMLACQSENNIPIVGKEQVNRNREMHWIRIDRYFTGKVADPQIVNQPMMCQHCESAPCENVCPVNATVHDDEGLNLMVYNRCVGTRYCSNNCPYKVRRFNFFDYNRRPLDELYKSPLLSAHDGEWEMSRWWKNPDRGSRKQDEWDLVKLVKNPDVTVRMRGVMEKCTYCLQRIEQAKISRKVAAGASNAVEVPDGTIKTACQQACPADAFVFGNLKDPNSRVSKAKANERTYKVLDFLATKPRTTYLARVRNPNPAMPQSSDNDPRPESTKEFLGHGGKLEMEGAGHGAHADAEHGAGAAEKGAH